MLLIPFEYHAKVRDYLKKTKKTWDWFATDNSKKEYSQKLKEDLLKNAYRLDSAEYPDIYKFIDESKEILGVNISVTVYQAPSVSTGDTNAGIVVCDNEAYVILSGQLLKLLSPEELKAVIAHELSHALFYTIENQEFEITDRIITALANSGDTEPEYFNTAKKFRLYMELFCDLGAFKVVKDIEPVITSLVKLTVGLEKVSAKSYLAQADELFANNKNISTEGVSHPENFIRARSIKLLTEEITDTKEIIKKMIEGEDDIDTLDLFNQEELFEDTKKLIQLILKPKWIQTDLILSLARQYFPDFKVDTSIILTDDLRNTYNNKSASIKEYFTYVLIDFSKADSSLEKTPTGLVLQLAEDLGIGESFEKVYKKEFKLSDKNFEDMKKTAMKDYSLILESKEEQIYGD